MQRKKSTKDTRNAAYQRLKKEYENYARFNHIQMRELDALKKENGKLQLQLEYWRNIGEACECIDA